MLVNKKKRMMMMINQNLMKKYKMKRVSSISPKKPSLRENRHLLDFSNNVYYDSDDSENHSISRHMKKMQNTEGEVPIYSQRMDYYTRNEDQEQELQEKLEQKPKDNLLDIDSLQPSSCRDSSNKFHRYHTQKYHLNKVYNKQDLRPGLSKKDYDIMSNSQALLNDNSNIRYYNPQRAPNQSNKVPFKMSIITDKPVYNQVSEEKARLIFC